MKSMTLTVLGLAAAAAIGGVLLVESRRGGEVEVAAGNQRFVPELQARANDVALVTVQDRSRSLSFRRTEGGWELVEKGGYPVQFEKVRAAIVGLAELRAIEPKTSKPELYEKLNVQDPGSAAPLVEGEGVAASGPPIQVTMKDAKEQTIASVIVGNPKWDSKPGVYVRKSGEAQSWQAEGQLDVSTHLGSWVESKILDLPRERISGVSVRHPDGEVVTVSRNSPEVLNFTVQGVPPGKELKSASSGDALGTALSWVSFEDVAAAGSLEGGTPGPTSEFRTFDGLVITARLTERNGATWAQFAASFDESVSPPVKTGIRTAEEARQEAAELSAKLSRWVYQLPSYKVVTFKSRMAEMLKDSLPAMPGSMEGVQIVDPAQLLQNPPPPANIPPSLKP